MSGDERTDPRAAALLRLRYERDLGLEAVRPLRAEARASAPILEPVFHSPLRSPSAPPPLQATVPAPRPSLAPAPAPCLTENAAAGLFAAERDVAGLSPEEKERRWTTLEARAKACTLCVLHNGRHNVVFGEGNRQARLVFVGEGPGEEEDRTGRPFVGRAGQLLDKIIASMGLRREEVYICNVVKCRPPDNRTPLPDEAAACNPYLEEQLALLAPKAIVALGAPASKLLLRTTQGITALRGRWHLYRGIRVMPTFHPAFVLRQYTEQVRRNVWDDMKQVVNYLMEA